MVADGVVESDDDMMVVPVLELEPSLELLFLAAAAVICGLIVEGSLKKSSSEACEDERPVLKNKCISCLIIFCTEKKEQVRSELENRWEPKEEDGLVQRLRMSKLTRPCRGGMRP